MAPEGPGGIGKDAHRAGVFPGVSHLATELCGEDVLVEGHRAIKIGGGNPASGREGEASAMNYNYYRTFIRVSADCPVKRSVIPVVRGERVSIAVLEYGLLSSSPYVYTQEELLFQVHVRRQGISRSVLESEREALWSDFFSRSRACLRTSPLPKTYGWGLHFDNAGKIALVPMESEEYRRFESDGSLTHVPAMRNRRA